MVQALTSLPNVVANTTSGVGWLNANTTWWLNPRLWRDRRGDDRTLDLADGLERHHDEHEHVAAQGDGE